MKEKIYVWINDVDRQDEDDFLIINKKQLSFLEHLAEINLLSYGIIQPTDMR